MCQKVHFILSNEKYQLSQWRGFPSREFPKFLVAKTMVIIILGRETRPVILLLFFLQRANEELPT